MSYFSLILARNAEFTYKKLEAAQRWNVKNVITNSVGTAKNLGNQITIGNCV